MDEKSRKTLSRTSDLNLLASALPDPTDANLVANPPELMASTWQNLINSGNMAELALPKTAANQVRVYQRTFQLNP